MTPLLTRRALLVGGALTATGAAAIVATPHGRAPLGRPLGTLVPVRIGGWAAHPDAAIVLPDATPQDRLYDALLSRTYVGAALAPIMLVIAHGGAGSTSWSVHRPETCYRASGFAIGDLQDVRWPVLGRRSVPGRMMTATLGTRVEQVGYWRRIGDGFPLDESEERMLALRYRLTGVIPDGILVRISTIGTDLAASNAAIAGFAAALVAACDAEARRLLLGPRFAT